ncbi:hypothetical protein HQQ81_22245 [Microbacteriaceae bacterium VKM Ac-2854]|nr:hypothetical protein [Microbacteriaceae bacterium VKM Ac-2854]
MTALGTLLFVVLGLAGVLAFSAVMKWRDPHGSVEAVRAFRVPARLIPAVSVGLPFAELGLAVGLLLLPGVLFAIVAWLAFVLFAAFTLVVGAALARGEAPECHCFGELSAEPVGRGTVVRNVVLTILALVVAIVLGNAAWPSLIAVIATLRGDLLVEVVVLVAIAATLTLLWTRQTRIRAELAEQSARLSALTPPEPESGPVAIPELSVWTSDGTAIALPGLSRDRATLLILVSPSCGHCGAVVARVPQWRAELSGIVEVLPVSTGEVAESHEAFPDTTELLFDRDQAVLHALAAEGTPSAILLGTNGAVGGGPVGGVDAIDEFITGIVEAIELNRDQHTPMPGDEPREATLPVFEVTPATTQAGWDDAELPSAELIAEDGSAIDLRDVAEGRRRALVFWRSDCAYCESILPEVLPGSAAGTTVLVTTSEPETVRAQGLTGRLYVSPDRAALAAMQVPGTPVGFLVEGHHVLAGPFIGADAVRELVAQA